MIQLIPHVQYGVSFASATTHWPLLGSEETYDPNKQRTPMPWAVIVRNLVLYSGDSTRVGDVTATLQKNAVDTALAVTFQASDVVPVLASGVDVSFAQYDDCRLKFTDTGGSAVAPGYAFGWCAELESQGNVFGIAANVFGFTAVGNGGIGGALGNGFWQTYEPAAFSSPTARSTTYSICSAYGSVTQMVMRTYATPPAIGSSWVGYMRLNGVIQDGTGGTVNTKCEIVGNGSLDRAAATFNLPCIPGDIVEVLYYRTGTDAVFESAGKIGVGIGFIPTTAGTFMLTGGSNQALVAPGFTYALSAPLEDDELLAQAPVGPGGFTATGLYIEAPQPGPNPADQVTRWLRKSGVNTLIAIVMTQLDTSGSITGTIVRYSQDDFITIFQDVTGGSPAVARLYWGLALAPYTAGGGIIGPLAWLHWPRTIPGSPLTVVTDSYSDHDMACPAAWENGFKEGLITRWGDVERASSHLFTGEWQGSTFNYQIADKSNRFRAQAASFVDRYWNDAQTVRMTTRANRAALGAAYTVFSGPIIDAQTDGMGTWDMTLGDVVSQGLLSDQSQCPWRQIKDGFLSELSAISDALDRDAPEPILYGRLTRAATDLGSPLNDEGIRVVPVYLGIMDVSSLDYHVWLVCGHAVSDIEIFVDDVQQIEFSFFSEWLIPHHAQFQAEFGTPYQDKPSDTYPGQTRRYTLIYGNVGRTEPDNCALGDQTLTAAVWGIEDAGDGGGSLITDRFQQYKHFLINYVANQGAQSYMTGAWLTNPTWDIFDGPIEKVEESTFDDATARGLARLSTGYLGAAAIGIQAGDRFSVKKWIADWNRSCACRFGITHLGQMRIFLLSPTDALKSVAPLYTDAYEILEDSFRTDLAWDEQATDIPFKTDFNNATGAWLTNGVEIDDAAAIALGSVTNPRHIPSEDREYPFAPGDYQARHLAVLELRIRKERPHYIRLAGTIGPDPVTDESLAYRDIGDYIRYIHFDAVSQTRSERIAQVITPGIRVGPRIVTIVAMDCEDLIDYDLNSSP